MTQVITEQGDLGLGVYDCPEMPLAEMNTSDEDEKEDKDKK